jgi:tetratricopeptide (TPR) repeat protein
MKKLTVFLCVCLCAVSVVAQTQQGVTYRYNGKQKRTPLGQVSISYDGNKRTVLSDAKDGTFTLVLDGRKMGDRIGLVTVKKREMMVFNQHAVDEWSVRKEPLMLILCNADEFERQKNNYIEIGKRQAKKKYDKQKAELEAQLQARKVKQQEYEAALDKAYEDLDRLQKNIGEYADLLARIDQSELDGQMQEVLDLYERGQVDEAMSRLDAMQLGKLLDKTLQKKSFHEQGLEEATQDSVLLVSKIKSAVNLYKNSGEYEKAGENLKLLADRLNTVDDCLAFANFCYKQNQFTEAETYFQRALALLKSQSDHKSTSYQSKYSRLQNNLAVLYSNTQRFTESESLYKEALEIRRRLVQSNPQAHEPDVAMILNNLALLYSDTQRFTESEQLYKEALEIRRRLAQTNPQAYESDLASSLNNLAILYQYTQQDAESESLYKEALEIHRRLAHSNPQVYEPDLAGTLNNLAILYKNTQRYVEAESLYKESLKIRRRLAQSNPQAYESGVARTLYNLAILYQNTQRFTESESLYKEVLEIYRRLAHSNPHAYEPDLASTLYNLALLYQNTQRLTEAESLYKEALEIYRLLAHSNPQAYEPDVAMTLSDLATLYYKTQRYAESESLYKEALEIRRRLAHSNPQAYEPDVAMTLNNLAISYKNTQRFTEAESLHKEALEIYRRLAQSNPQAYEPDLANTLNNMAALYSDTQRFVEAEPLYKEALEIRRRLAQSNPQAYDPDLAQTQYNLGLLKIKTEQYSDAIPFFEGSLGISRKAAKKNPALQNNYVGSLYWLSLLYSETKNYPAIYAINQEWLPILKGMYENNPDGLKSNYVSTLGNQAFYAIFMKQFIEAEQYAREAIAIDSTKHIFYTNLAAALLFQGKYGEAEEIYRQYKDELKDGFLDDLKQFAEAGVIPKECEADVEKIKKLLEE